MGSGDCRGIGAGIYLEDGGRGVSWVSFRPVQRPSAREPALQESGRGRPWLEGLEFDFELAQSRVPSDVNQVPLVLQIAHDAIVHQAQVTKRRGLVYQLVDGVPTRGTAFAESQDHFQFLDNEAFQFQKLGFIGRVKLRPARQSDEVPELSPGLKMILNPGDHIAGPSVVARRAAGGYSRVILAISF